VEIPLTKSRAGRVDAHPRALSEGIPLHPPPPRLAEAVTNVGASCPRTCWRPDDAPPAEDIQPFLRALRRSLAGRVWISRS